MASNFSNQPLTTVQFNPNQQAASSSNNPQIQIIAQPCYTSKLRYRSDYNRNRSRRGDLRSENNNNFRCPAILIPSVYYNSSSQYYVRICLVTVFHQATNRRYIHPYELEDSRENAPSARENRAVWFPVEKNDVDAIKSFPHLRIVKKTAAELTQYGNLDVFDCPEEPSVPQLFRAKDIIKEFNLERSHLAFTMGQKGFINGVETYIPFNATTVLSDELVEKSNRTTELGTGNEPTTSQYHQTAPLTCQVYKYGPRRGYSNANDEVLLFFTNKLETRKYGALEINFEYATANPPWSEAVLDLEVKEQMVSFLTPTFPFPITDRTTVTVNLKQKKRAFTPLTFDYVAPALCSRCQQSLNPTTQTNFNTDTFAELNSDTLFDDPNDLG